jgi:hypothetical protein
MIQAFDPKKPSDQFEAAMQSEDGWSYSIRLMPGLGVVSVVQGDISLITFRSAKEMREAAMAMYLAADKWDAGEFR